MAELQPVPFADLVRRIRREVVTSQAIFDLPVRMRREKSDLYDVLADFYRQDPAQRADRKR